LTINSSFDVADSSDNGYEGPSEGGDSSFHFTPTKDLKFTITTAGDYSAAYFTYRQGEIYPVVGGSIASHEGILNAGTRYYWNAFGTNGRGHSGSAMTQVTLIPKDLTTVIGDTNYDLIVNGQDIAQIASAWMATGFNEADTNGDGIVNGQDIALVASNWLATAPPNVATATAVPEPSTLALAAVGLLSLSIIRRRK